MSNERTISEIKKEINILINNVTHNILIMSDSENSQVKAMVIKNQGYRLALEDIQKFILNKRI